MRLAEKQKRGRTVTLKVKFSDFEIITRRRTVDTLIGTAAEMTPIVHDLLEVVFPVQKGVRLLGATVSGFDGSEEPNEDQMVLI